MSQVANSSRLSRHIFSHINEAKVESTSRDVVAVDPHGLLCFVVV